MLDVQTAQNAFDWFRIGAYQKVVEIIQLLPNPITDTSFCVLFRCIAF